MPNSLNLSLTDELRNFIDQNCGEGTLYNTPSEFVRDIIRQRKIQDDVNAARNAIIEGYHDAIEGRTSVFKGDLQQMINKAKQR